MDKEQRAQLQQAVAGELARANSWDAEQWEPSRLEGVKLYEGTLPDAPADPDLSGAVSADVGDMTEAIIAQMQPAFTGVPAIAFTPTALEDEQPADMETWFVHRELSRNGQDFVAVTSGLRDALLSRTCIFKVWMDEREDEETRTFSDVPESAASSLITPARENEERELEGGDYGAKNAEGNYASFNVKVRTTAQALRVEAIAPEDFRKWADWQRPTLAGCPFVAERLSYVRGELLGLGVPEELALEVPVRPDSGDQTKAARAALPGAGVGSVDPWLDPVICWRVYIRCEFSEGTYGELYSALWSESAVKSAKGSGGVGFFLTDPEAAPFHCYCSGAVLLQSHRFLGKSAADKLKQTQFSKTEVLRQWLDNLAYLNNGRIVSVQGLSNPEQLAANNKPGGILDAKQKGAVEYIIGPDAGPSALAALNYLDKARAEAGGASLDLQTTAADKSETWRGTERQYSAKEMLAQLMLRTFAETGLREMYLLAHRTLRVYALGALQGKPRGEWTSQAPSDWPERTQAEVVAGAAGSAMTARVQGLTATLQEQLTALQSGQEGVLVTLPQVYQTLLGLGRARGLQNIERLWTDPSSPPARQAAQQKQAAAVQSAQFQASFMERIASLQVALQAWEKRLDASVKYFSKVIDAEVEQMKVLGHSTTELERLQLEGLSAAIARAPANVEDTALQMAGAGKGGGNGAAAPSAPSPAAAAIMGPGNGGSDGGETPPAGAGA